MWVDLRDRKEDQGTEEIKGHLDQGLAREGKPHYKLAVSNKVMAAFVVPSHVLLFNFPSGSTRSEGDEGRGWTSWPPCKFHYVPGIFFVQRSTILTSSYPGSSWDKRTNWTTRSTGKLRLNEFQFCVLHSCPWMCVAMQPW